MLLLSNGRNFSYSECFNIYCYIHLKNKCTQRSLKILVLVMRSFCWPNSNNASLAFRKVIDHVRNLAQSSWQCLSGFTFHNWDKCRKSYCLGRGRWKKVEMALSKHLGGCECHLPLKQHPTAFSMSYSHLHLCGIWKGVSCFSRRALLLHSLLSVSPDVWCRVKKKTHGSFLTQPH